MRFLGVPDRAKIILAGCCILGALSASGQTPVAIGIVFTGGGSFGAFEVGALQGFFEDWVREHGVPPPIRVIAGTSTGALIGPFAALGQEGVHEVAELYRSARLKDIFALRPKVLLPFALFTKWSSSVYSSDPLAKLIRDRLTDEKLRRIGAMWPETRVVVLATDFGSGQPATYSNAPAEMGQGLSRIRDGILASASSPLTAPPLYLKSDSTQTLQPFIDGGVSEVAPFQAFFDLAAQPPGVALTHIVIISPYPPYPGTDAGQAQRKPFPAKPNFEELSARTGSLISESTISKEIALAWAAISLRQAGMTAEKVKQRTGLDIPQPPVELILIAPNFRLGWDTLNFDPREMEEMFKRGLEAERRTLIP